MTTTETQTGTELDAQALTTWAQLRAVQARIAELAAEEDTLKATLREHLGAGEFTVGRVPVFTIKPGHKYSEAAARAALTPDEIASCTVEALDRAKVQATVSPDVYRACQVETTPSIRAAK